MTNQYDGADTAALRAALLALNSFAGETVFVEYAGDTIQLEVADVERGVAAGKAVAYDGPAFAPVAVRFRALDKLALALKKSTHADRVQFDSAAGDEATSATLVVRAGPTQVELDAAPDRQETLAFGEARPLACLSPELILEVARRVVPMTLNDNDAPYPQSALKHVCFEPQGAGAIWVGADGFRLAVLETGNADGYEPCAFAGEWAGKEQIRFETDDEGNRHKIAFYRPEYLIPADIFKRLAVSNGSRWLTGDPVELNALVPEGQADPIAVEFRFADGGWVRTTLDGRFPDWRIIVEEADPVGRFSVPAAAWRDALELASNYTKHVVHYRFSRIDTLTVVAESDDGAGRLTHELLLISWTGAVPKTFALNRKYTASLVEAAANGSRFVNVGTRKRSAPFRFEGERFVGVLMPMHAWLGSQKEERLVTPADFDDDGEG